MKQIDLEPIDFRDAGDRKKARRGPAPWEFAVAPIVVGLPLLAVLIGSTRETIGGVFFLVGLGVAGGILIGLGIAKVRHRRP